MNYKASQLYSTLAQHLKDQCCAMAMVTLIEKKGSAPQQAGAKMLIVQGQALPLYGTIGGGALEDYAINFINQQLNSHNTIAQMITLNLQGDLAMHCGGEVKLLFEFFMPQRVWQIVVFGAGHISQALVPLLCQLDAMIYCLDERNEWLEQIPDKANLNKIHLTEDNTAERFLAKLNAREEAFFICLNRTHKMDYSLCKMLYLSTTPAYVGVIGSRAKALKLQKKLHKAGLTNEQLSSLHCPVGSQKMAHTPFEIAISICAQLLEQRANKP